MRELDLQQISDVNDAQLSLHYSPKLCTFLLDLYRKFTSGSQYEGNGPIARGQQRLTVRISESRNPNDVYSRIDVEHGWKCK